MVELSLASLIRQLYQLYQLVDNYGGHTSVCRLVRGSYKPYRTPILVSGRVRLRYEKWWETERPNEESKFRIHVNRLHHVVLAIQQPGPSAVQTISVSHFRSD